jgi:hypothetical protein
VRDQAGDRFAEIELNLFVAVAGAKAADVDLSVLTAITGRTADEVMRLPAVLVGPPQQIAERLLRCREANGSSCVSVLEDHMHAFAEVIPLLR